MRSEAGRCGAGAFEEPRLDLPVFTVDPRTVFGDRLPDAVSPEPLPALLEGDGPPVRDPVDEPLVEVEHRRIRTLSNYWYAGWHQAVPFTLLRRGVYERLVDVAEGLPPRWGLAVFDAWRPLGLQAELYEAAYADPRTPPGFMAPVSDDPATPPPHLTGGAVDLTLTFDGMALAPGCGFDDVTSRAGAAALEDEPGVARDVRRLLYWSMRAAGFVVFAGEWWHFEYGTRRWALVTGGRCRYGPAAPSGRPARAG